MIYRQTGFKSNVLKVINTDKTALETLASTNAPTISEDEDIKQYKTDNMLYFISGDITPNEDGSYTRNDSNLKTRDLIVIDIEDTGLTSQEVQNIIQEKLASYKYLLYSTISHKQNNPRLRLVLEPSRDIVKDEYKPTIQHIIQLLNIKYDTSSCTWSQLQGLPIAVRDNEFIFIKRLEGEPYPVQKARRLRKRKKETVSNNGTRITDDEYKGMFQRYLELDIENINPDDDNNYNRALGILLSLSRDVCYNIISEKVAYECSDLLANIGANPEKYRQDNLVKINNAINHWENDPNYFETEQSYSMLDKFMIVGKEKDTNFTYLVKYTGDNVISSTKELHNKLFELGEQWREENTIVNEKTGKETIPQMPFYVIAKYILENIPIRKSGINEDTAMLYFYDFSKGIYTPNEDYLKSCIKKIEVRYKLTKLKDITEDLRANTRFEKPHRLEHLIAVENGLFNTETKKLEPFNPKHFITAKVNTNYNENAIENYECIKNTYFDYDNWLNSIACNDEDVVTLLWQLINEALNPNKTRRKIAIMLGSGTNGKSTFRQMIINLIGDINISVSTPHELQSRFGLTSLEGKICNYGDEVGTKPLDEMDKLKSISSGESVNYERKSKDVRSYDFKTLLLFNSNEMPVIKDKSEAVLNRLLIIPFKANFTGKADKSIKDEKLKNKIVLEYILYKALHLNFDKFIVPKVVQHEIEKYKGENDSVYSYLSYYIENDYHNVSCMPISFINSDYEDYCEENGYKYNQKIGTQFAGYLNNKFENDNYQYEVKNHRFSKDNTKELKLFKVNIKPVEGKVKSALKQVIIKHN